MLVKPDRSILVLVTERSCRYKCPHCFCDPGMAKGDFAGGREVVIQAYKLGYSAYFYATHFNESCLEIYRSIGQDLRDASICVREGPALKSLEHLRQQKGRIGFSLHGARSETHELLSGRGTFPVLLRAIREARRMCPDATLNAWCAVSKKNVHEIKDLVALCHELGIDTLSLMKLSFLGRARTLPADWFLDREDIRDFLQTVQEIYEENVFPTPHVLLIPNWGMTVKQAEKFENNRKLMYYQTNEYCPAGRQHFTVDSKSLKVWPCHHLVADERFVIGHWTAEGILVEKPIFEHLYDYIGEPCRSCELLRVCGGGCRAEAIGEHMRLTGECDMFAGLENCRKYLVK